MSDPCEKCGRSEGHELLPTDCVMPHKDHSDRFMGLLCSRHYHWIDRTLVQIEELFALRGDVLLPGSGGDERSATRVGSPAPGRIDVMALTDPRGIRDWIGDPDAIPDIPGALDLWVRVMSEEHSTLNLDTYTATVSGAVRVLRRERRWIARQAWVDDYVNELHDLHRAVARGVGAPMWPEPIGKCPNCQTPMFTTIGADEATCRRCKTTWTGVHLARLRLIHEQEEARKRDERSSA